MSENSRRFIQAIYALEAVANRVPAEAWDNPSCCSEWTAREVAGHAAWVVRNVGAATGNIEAPAPQAEADHAGPDPAATIRSAVRDTIEALDQQGVLQPVSQTPFGEMTIDAFLGIVAADPLTHAWDIADAAGIDHGIDPTAAAAAHAALAPMSEGLRMSGRFGPVIDADGDAIDQYIGFVGRQSVQGQHG